jgi:hypothetical protein
VVAEIVFDLCLVVAGCLSVAAGLRGRGALVAWAERGGWYNSAGAIFKLFGQSGLRAFFVIVGAAMALLGTVGLVNAWSRRG